MRLFRATQPDLMKFLTDLMNRNAAYHDHKETLAWASVALYLAGIVQIRISAARLDTVSRLEIALVSTIVTVGFLAYARRQFNLRYHAAMLDSALQRLTALALAGHLDGLHISDLMPVTLPSRSSPHVYERLGHVGRLLRGARTIPRYVTPRRLGRLAFPPRHEYTSDASLYPAFVMKAWQEQERGALRRALELEQVTYVLLAVAAAATIGSLLWE